MCNRRRGGAPAINTRVGVEAICNDHESKADGGVPAQEQCLTRERCAVVRGGAVYVTSRCSDRWKKSASREVHSPTQNRMLP
jgi:hypothetical protein